ncbi:PLP-dependent aminotransferase family protein [Deinococcus humi]|uniref:GntR family transcriptional regulator/MocR family aminotransferase n=1 Tax=Deinococcus humi TaxID=662880 RepID=A0A7W8NDQ8_9DEIO|nr:PLP-dependent aminotransferase family protein [Deinococcus humi]MBB5361875.1 GntR family transcriptional regulator/MocR family aminotransferase [Deinococcus humi]GGO23206.1 GntR family transcriptional regulator [Deinococcus humi]
MVAPREDPLLPKQNSPLAGTLPIALNLSRGAVKPLHTQLADELRAAALAGTLPAGLLLPGSRTLAAELGVTRGVVADAYAELVTDGTLEAAVGRGTRVSEGATQTGAARMNVAQPNHTGGAPGWFSPPLPAPVEGPNRSAGIHFRVGVATTATLNTRAWRQAWAAAARTLVTGDYGDPAGEPELRAALSAFVARSRGLSAPPERVLVTAGSLQALNLILRALPPGSGVLFEFTGYRAARQAILDAGHVIVPLEQDVDGPVIRPDIPPARLAYVTPSHGFPLGGRMSVPRRLALLEWAARHDALIVEDDYDGEFRYGAPPLPTLASLDAQGRVLYLGTLSKVLSPGLRTGFLIGPPALMPSLVRARTLLDSGHPLPVQHAVLHLLRTGEVDRHIRRTRRWHAGVRDALARTLGPLSPQAMLGGIEAGLHVCLHLSPPLEAQAVSGELGRRGVFVSTLDSYTFAGAVPNALLLGYGGLTIQQAQTGAQEIVRVISGR